MAARGAADMASTAPARRLRLQLRRTPQLLNGAAATPLNRLDAALLALLALEGATSRSRVVALLWPEADEDAARNVLRQRLFRLRRAAGRDVVVQEELLALAAGVAHDLDLAALDLLADAEAADGELLAGFEYDELLGFAHWLATARSQWHAARRDALAAIAARLEEEDRVAQALVYAQRLAREEPLLEHAQRRLMRLHYRRGDRGAALAAYEAFCQALDHELGETPSRETRQLAALIEDSGALPVAATPPRPVAVLRPPRLIGRQAQWRLLEAAWADGQLGIVTGEPGIGKTRLIADFAAAHGVCVVPTRAGDARVPYALLARLLQALAPAQPAVNPGLQPWVRDELARVVPQFAMPAAGGQAAGALPLGRVDPLRLGHAVQAWLCECSVAGIVIDDLQFADEATLAMLPQLVDAAGAAGKRWLLAWRINEPPAGVDAWLAQRSSASLVRLQLDPLDATQVRLLLESLALPAIDAPRWAARVHRHSGGNPMFILETLLAMLSRGVPDDDAARLPLPENLRHLIQQRLAQLTPAALKLARVAALAGSDFSVELAAGVLEQHPLDLLDAWRELEAAQVMQDNAFAHDLIAEASRESVPAPLARWLHARIAGVLETRHALPSRLAPHWRAAGEPARAAVRFSQAADAARAAGRLSEESRLLEAAIACHRQADDADGAFAAMTRRATAALESLSPTEAMQAAQALQDAAANDGQRGVAHKQLAACHMYGARFELALPELEQAIACSDRAGDMHSANHARSLQALSLAQTLGVEHAVRRMEPLLAWAEAQPDQSLRHSFLADLAILWDQNDQRRRARPYFERALAYFEREHESGNSATARMMFARSLLMLGDLPRARLELEAATRARDELSEGEGGQGIEVLNLGRVYCELGLYGQALKLLEPSRERLARHGSAVVRAATALVMARVYAYLGQVARARALFAEVPADPPFHQQATSLWTQSLLAHEQPAQRLQLLDAALACFEPTDMPFVRLPIEFDRIACAGAADAVDACRARVAECERRELPAPQMLGRMRLVQILLARGDAATALTIVHGLLPDLQSCLPVGAYLPELYWLCHAAARDGGDSALAAHCLDAAVRWITATALPDVPPPFRESFLQRNPVNRRVLTTASRV